MEIRDLVSCDAFSTDRWTSAGIERWRDEVGLVFRQRPAHLGPQTGSGAWMPSSVMRRDSQAEGDRRQEDAGRLPVWGPGAKVKDSPGKRSGEPPGHSG